MFSALSITNAVFEDAVRAGIRAPSMYNSQPWRFRMTGGAIEVYTDLAASLPKADPDGWAARVALGAAAANVQLALASAGLVSTTTVRTSSTPARALVRPTSTQVMPPADRALFDAIGLRRSHRLPFWPTPVPTETRARLADAAQHAGCWLEFVDDRAAVSRVAEIVRSADERLGLDDLYVAELRLWTGRSEDDAVGIGLTAAGLAPEGQDLLAMRDYGGKTRAAGRDYEPEPLLGVLGTVGGSRYDDVMSGMALQKVLLTATADRVATSMLSQPMEVPAARAELRDDLTHYGVPQMLIRFGYGQPGSLSPRRPIAAVIDTDVESSASHHDENPEQGRSR